MIQMPIIGSSMTGLHPLPLKNFKGVESRTQILLKRQPEIAIAGLLLRTQGVLAAYGNHPDIAAGMASASNDWASNTDSSVTGSGNHWTYITSTVGHVCMNGRVIGFIFCF
ncbi:hypothetical protein BK665_10425 [Pseudomonas frederiksbergensis]|uniref:Uncharacterized protein n=1 Tax=Pseudomonas frederiksbergensis TaxID=104087 RepID=A0A423KLH5_9PSED|nr:hypothetical protein BK665_10425 [Pseudomonas frederiksbergensis]